MAKVVPYVDDHIHATAVGPTASPTFNEDGTHFHATPCGPTGPNEPIDYDDHRHKMFKHAPGDEYTSGEFRHSRR